MIQNGIIESPSICFFLTKIELVVVETTNLKTHMILLGKKKSLNISVLAGIMEIMVRMGNVIPR